MLNRLKEIKTGFLSLAILLSLLFGCPSKGYDIETEKIISRDLERQSIQQKLLNFKWFGQKMGQPHIARFEDKEKNATCWIVAGPTYDSVSVSCLPNKN